MADRAQSGPKERVWSTVEPPEIDNTVAIYILSVTLLILRQFHVLIRRPRVGGHTRTGTSTDFDVYNLRGARDDTTRIANSLYPFTSYRFDRVFAAGDSDTGVKSRPPQEQIPASAFDLVGTSFHLSNSPVTFTWLIQAYASRLVFQLSCSNWSVVFGKIRQKIRQFADRSVDDRIDVVDIYIIKYAALTRTKLIAIMQGEKIVKYLWAFLGLPLQSFPLS
jgi:neurofibromin 1